jgi:uncharacterized protein involved in exopolysaccharide biosynthesis
MHEEGLNRRVLEAPSPTVRELVMVLFRQRNVLLCVAALIFGAAAFFALTGTSYQAHMKILVRRGRADAPVTAQENAPVDLTRMAVTEEDLNSEVELLRDDAVLRKVAEDNGLARRDWLHFIRPHEAPAAQMERAARRLAKKIQVEPIKKTDLIVVSYSSDDPALSTRVVQSLARAYLEEHKQVHRPAEEFHFFDQQTDESRIQLDEAKRKLVEFSTSRGVVIAGQQRDLGLQRLSEADANYRQTQVELAETQRRVQELAALLTALPERTITQIRTADNPELLKALKSSLLDLEMKRTQMLTKFEPGHPLVLEVEEQLAQAKSAIAAESLAPVRDETTDRNPNYEWAKAELQHSHVQLKVLEAKVSATGLQLASYRAMTRRLGEDAIEQDDLLSAEKAAQDNHLLYVKKREESRMDDALDQHGIVNVAIAEQPVVPALPVWSAWSVLLVGFVIAGASGVGVSFAADYMDPAFRTPDEVLAYLDAPVLASLPKRSAQGRLSA